MAGTSRKAMQALAEEAAEKAVAKLMLALGADVSNPLQMQRNFAFLDKMRSRFEAFSLHAGKAVVGAIVVALIGLIGVGLSKTGGSP